MTAQKNKPVLDEQTFEKLLEAAFVLQEYNHKMQELEENLESQTEQLREQQLTNQALKSDSDSAPLENAGANVDYTLTLAEIVEAQNQIQIRHLDLDKALAVVAERITRITNASGAGIGILEEATVRYRAGAGPAALPVGTEVPLKTAICQANVRTGHVTRTEDVETEFLFDPESCRQRGIRSLIAVPVYHNGDIVGALELYFAKVNGYAEQDIHTCQLMAGLVSEALGRDSESALKKSVAAERSTMMAAIERLQPNLAALVADRPESEAVTRENKIPSAALNTACWKCGAKLLQEEQFCGKCGAHRSTDSDDSTQQNKLTNTWLTQPASENDFANPPANGSSRSDRLKQAPSVRLHDSQIDSDEYVADFPESPLAGVKPPVAKSGQRQSRPGPAFPGEREAAFKKSMTSALEVDEHSEESPARALVAAPQDLVTGSTAKVPNFAMFPESGGSNKLAYLWQTYRGDFYLAVAVILVVVVIGWGAWSGHSAGAADSGAAISRSANRGKRPAPDPDLSAFERLLIFLGLAEAPAAAPEYKGNPDTQVWIDLNTALYYCPGSDLYEKTVKGKLSSQRDAQLDQFEPASRKACD